MNRNPEASRRPRKAPLRQVLGRRIVQARKRKGWSQEKLARRLEVSKGRVGKWERGLHTPSLEDVAKLSGVLEVTLEELILGARAPAPEIPPAERNEATMHLDGFLRVVRRWLQPPGAKEKKAI
jgi:transcriptional regulator with XRE-family HTH domain